MHTLLDAQTLVHNGKPVEVRDKPQIKALPLVRKLCHQLAAEGISYCHWKSNNALDRSASGENDLDLLVSETDGARFEAIIQQLGFKQALAPAEKAMPGVFDYFGYEAEGDKFVHLHLHYHLVLGHDSSKNYRLPIEKPYLDSAAADLVAADPATTGWITGGDLFRVPAVEYEFVVFVIRMALKHLTWDLVLGGEGKLKASEERELHYLLARIDRRRVDDILARHLPYLERELFDHCVEALQPHYPAWRRIRIGEAMQARLQAGARRPVLLDLTLRVWRKLAIPLRRRVLKGSTKYRLAHGKPMIALVGGDGAGKTTTVKALHSWFSKHFETKKIHLGKPAWSGLTTAMRGVLKVGQLLGLYPVEASFRETIGQRSPVSPGYPWLIREACLARDRYRTYLAARAFAERGGVTLIDRYPLPHLLQMDGPQAERFVRQLAASAQAGGVLKPAWGKPLARFLVRLEERYYRRIQPPELLIVLRVDPEIAVQRKTDEDAALVRERSSEIWTVAWEQNGVYVVDSSKPTDVVISEIKRFIWSKLV